MTQKQLELRCSGIFNELGPDARKAFMLHGKFHSTIEECKNERDGYVKSEKIANASVNFLAFCRDNPQIRPEIERALQKVENLIKEDERDFDSKPTAEADALREKIAKGQTSFADKKIRIAKIVLAVSIVGYFAISVMMSALKSLVPILTIVRGFDMLAIWVSAGIWGFAHYKKKNELERVAHLDAQLKDLQQSEASKEKEKRAVALSAMDAYAAILSGLKRT